MSEKHRTSAVKNTLAGSVGGVCAVLSGHPFDTVKVGGALVAVVKVLDKVGAVALTESLVHFPVF